MHGCAHITLEAATPAEIKARGAGMTIRAGVAACPFGNFLIGETIHGICHLAFFDEVDPENALAVMRTEWPLAIVERDDAHASHLAGRLFSYAPHPSSEWTLFVRGTPFQILVWKSLLEIPYGAVVSYGRLATAVGNPRAARATGSAVGRNPIAFLIPCHRVIRGTGVPGDYRWGRHRKQEIMAWEAAHLEAR